MPVSANGSSRISSERKTPRMSSGKFDEELSRMSDIIDASHAQLPACCSTSRLRFDERARGLGESRARSSRPWLEHRDQGDASSPTYTSWRTGSRSAHLRCNVLFLRAERASRWSAEHSRSRKASRFGRATVEDLNDKIFNDRTPSVRTRTAACVAEERTGGEAPAVRG